MCRILAAAAVATLMLNGCGIGERPVLTRIGDVDGAPVEQAAGDAAPLSAEEVERQRREAAASECFVGEWRADNASFSALFFESGTIASDLITGAMFLTATLDGRLTTEFLDWSFETPTIALVPSAPKTVPVTTNSTETRDYVLNDDGSFSASATGDSSGEEPSRYSCEGDVLTVSMLGGNATFSRG